MATKQLIKQLLALLLCSTSAISLSATANVQVKGLLQIGMVNPDAETSFMDSGIGLYRYGEQDNKLILSQGIVDVSADLVSDWSAQSVINVYLDPEATLGLSQGFLKYQPLTSNRYKWHIRMGGFYPLMSLENPDIGWTSPYNYTNSAINSWIGEEIRTFGLEATLTRPGRRFNSPHSFSLIGASFKGNDPAGTLLSWRGFALHDRQTTFSENIKFARPAAFNYPQLSKQASQVLPFKEVDGRYGYYVGAHWDYLKRVQFRIYYYDNNGDPTAIDESIGQYAWDTRFTSIAGLYKLTPQTRIITQALTGKTTMGPNHGVNDHFYSYFVLLSHQHEQHRVSFRYDYFKVKDRGTFEFNPTQSQGEGITATWRYQLNSTIQLGLEASRLNSYSIGRLLINKPIEMTQQQIIANIQFRF